MIAYADDICVFEYVKPGEKTEYEACEGAYGQLQEIMLNAKIEKI